VMQPTPVGSARDLHLRVAHRYCWFHTRRGVEQLGSSLGS